METFITENITKTKVLEHELDHVSKKVEQLCDKIEKTLPLLGEMNLAIHENMTKTIYAERILLEDSKTISSLIERTRDLASIQINHQETIKKHDVFIEKFDEALKSQKANLNFTKVILVSSMSIIGLGLTAWGSWSNYVDSKTPDMVQYKID